MEDKIKELDMKALQEEILRKCSRKKTEPLVLPDARETEDNKKEDLHEKDVVSIETEKITDEKLLFENILTEKHADKYTTKEEFIYSLYNNILSAFVTEWNGYFLRRERFAKRFSQDNAEIVEENEEIDDYNKKDNLFIKKEKEEKDKLMSIPSRKLSLSDEFANIKFYNNNSYCGRISRKMMEGDGTYTWHNGVQYKGQFERNKIQGKGLLKWNDNCWYEGDFMDNLRHGKGILVNKENNCIYVGQWCMGHMCGKDKMLKHKYSSNQI